jgi:hypothetical protein
MSRYQRDIGESWKSVNGNAAWLAAFVAPLTPKCFRVNQSGAKRLGDLQALVSNRSAFRRKILSYQEQRAGKWQKHKC